MSTLKRDIIWTFFGNAFGACISIGSAAILARVLGPANRGLLGLAILLPTITVTFCLLGQDMVNATYAGLYKDKRSNLFQQTLIITFAGTIVSTLVICGFFFWFPASKGQFSQISTEIVWLIFLISPFMLLNRMLIALVRGVGRINSAAIIHVIQDITRLLFLVVFLVWMKFGLKAAVLISALNPAVAVICSLFVLRDYITLMPSLFSVKYFRKSLKFGSLVSLTTIASFLLYRLDQGMLGYMVPAREIGFYVVAVGLAERLRLLPNSISGAFLPRLANDVESRREQVPMIFRFTMIISWVSMLLVALAGIPALILIFGKEYLPSIPSFLLLLPGIAFLGGASVLSSDVAAREKPYYSMYTGYITLSTNIVLNIIMIPWLGIAGAAIASSLSYTMACVVISLFYRYESKKPLQELIPRWSDFISLFRMSMKVISNMLQNIILIFRHKKQIDG